MILEVERLDIFENGDELRTMAVDKSRVLARIREVYSSNEHRDIPSLKSKDRWQVMKEVKLVNFLLRNIIAIGITYIIKINRLLHAGIFVVCERLGMLKKKEKLKSRKPWWQRRLESCTCQWRKD